MATDVPAKEQAQAAVAESKGLPLKKLLIIGIPVFLVQLVVLFFLATKFFGPSSQTQHPATSGSEREAESKEPSNEGGREGAKEGAEQSIFVVKDLIVNPAGTNGSRFLLLTVGFETSTPEGAKELEKREIQVRDALNTILTAKALDELSGNDRREALRGEIQAKVGELLKGGAITNVYFSKFIIQ